MAFKPGALTMSANFTVGFAGPIDNRQVCDYVADLVTVSYPYMGMLVSVVGETSALNGVYVLKGADATNSSNWKQITTFE